MGLAVLVVCLALPSRADQIDDYIADQMRA
jgi:hypothetical protein